MSARGSGFIDMKHILFSLFFFLISLAYGQQRQGNTTRALDRRDLNVKGSPYLIDWVDGALTTVGGRKEGYVLRYNSFDDELEFTSENRVIALKRGGVLGFDFHEENTLRTFIFLSREVSKNYKGREGFFELIFESENGNRLLVKHLKRFLKPEAGMYGSEKPYDEYEGYKSYYLLRAEKLSKLKMTNNACIKHFGKSKKEILPN